jgi:hypothetical protein
VQTYPYDSSLFFDIELQTSCHSMGLRGFSHIQHELTVSQELKPDIKRKRRRTVALRITFFFIMINRNNVLLTAKLNNKKSESRIYIHFRQDSTPLTNRLIRIFSLSVFPDENGHDNSQSKCQYKGHGA